MMWLMIVAMGNQAKRPQNFTDTSMSPMNGRGMMQQGMIQHHQKDMIQQQQPREDIYSLATSSGHSWSSSPDTFQRPSSALRNSPTVYVLSLVLSVCLVKCWMQTRLPFSWWQTTCLCVFSLILKLDLGILKLYLHTMKFVRQGFQKLEPEPDRHTHTHR